MLNYKKTVTVGMLSHDISVTINENSNCALAYLAYVKSIKSEKLIEELAIAELNITKLLSDRMLNIDYAISVLNAAGFKKDQ